MAGQRINVGGIPYQIDREIGHGLHSLVYGGIDLTDGEPVAIKITNFVHGTSDVRARTESRRQSFWKEIQMLLYFQPINPHIIRVFNYDYNENYGIIVMERGKTFRDTMLDHVFSRTKIPPNLVKLYWSQMVESVYYMHQTGFVHGDIKPENFIQVGQDETTLRLIDMGISFRLPPNVTSRLKVASGTPDYVSPEMVNSRIGNSSYSRCGYKSDVWALGVILYEMAFGYRPLQFLPDNESKLNFLGQLQEDLNIPKYPDRKLRRVLKGCLRTNPRRRFSIEDILNHSYFNNIS